MDEEKNNIMEDYIRSLIKDELKNIDVILKKEEANEIVKAIMPQLDSLIADRIKLHFSELAKMVQQKFGGSDKGE
jgi:hypothetical protein